MTRRERLERKAERLRGWAAKREAGAAAVFKAGEPFRGDIAFATQPGHIPERARLIAREHRAFESLQKAEGMESRAHGIERALNRSIFSDDTDAPERLAERIAELEAKRDAMKKANAAFRRGGIDAVRADCGDAVALEGARTMQLCPWETRPFPAYAITNIGANIRRQQKRLEQIGISGTGGEGPAGCDSMAARTAEEGKKMTTKTYRIESEAGVVLGTYEGADEAEALDAFAREGGYADYAALCREMPRGRPTMADWGDAVRATEVVVQLVCGPVALHRDHDAFRWYAEDGADIEVSGATVEDAARALVAAYPYSNQWTDEGTAVVDALLPREVQP